ncbi:MAG: tetratricopeptide repeat protein, partial [Pseudobdellovibrionaceae bacterium]
MFFSALQKKTGILASVLFMTACSHSPLEIGPSGKEAYYEAAFFDRNRAPAFVTPPPVVGEKEPVSPMQMQTQADYHFSMGEALSLEGQHEKAVEAFKNVLIYDPKAITVHLRLSSEYSKLSLLTEALEHAEQALKLDPKSVDGHLAKGGLYSAMRMYPSAVKEYDEVMKLDPANTEAPLFVGALWAEKKQFEKAVGYFEKLVKNEDYSTPFLAHYYIGRVRLEQGTE